MRGMVGVALSALLSLAVLPSVSIEEIQQVSIGDEERQFTPIPQERHLAMVCFYTGEQMSGMNKICYYNCAGSGAAITISSVQLCPMQIQG